MIQTPADTPRPGEPRPLQIALLGIAGSGKTRLAAGLRTALTSHGGAASGLVISDGPALTSLLSYGDKALQNRQARARILLMGLDLPAQGGVHADQAATDAELRQALGYAGVAYSVIYGLGPARLQNALDALRTSTPGPLPNIGVSDRQRLWVWACDSCSDPGCERRLLSALLAGRTS